MIFFLSFLLCFFLTLYSNFAIAFNFPLALVASNQIGEGGQNPLAGRRTVAGQSAR